MSTDTPWLDLTQEASLEPDLPICDPHHHLWRHPGIPEYLLDDLWADTGSGHNIVKTVFVECAAEYRSDGPEELRSLGAVAFVPDIAHTRAAGGPGRAEIAALVSHIDLTQGDAVEEIAARHLEQSGGLFRGVRHATHGRPAHRHAALHVARAVRR